MPDHVVAMPPFAPLFGVGGESVTVRWLTVQYRTRPEVLAGLLPAPLQPADGEPLAAIWVAEFLGASFRLPDGSVERRPPYSQAGVSVRCRHGDRVGAYPLTFFIEGLNHGILGREIFGLPKKQARSVLLRADADGVTGGITTANGIDVVSVRAHRHTEPADLDPIPDWFGNHFPLKLIPSAEGTGYDVNRLVRVPFRTSAPTGGWAGAAEVTLTPSTADPLHLVECVEVVDARYGRVDLEVGFGTYLERVDEIPTFGVPDWS